MTSKQSREALFTRALIGLDYNIKEWKRLTMELVGLNRYQNLLSEYNICDPLWNIVMNYIQINVPSHHYTDSKYSDFKMICGICHIIHEQTSSPRNIIMYNRISNIKYYTVICYSCILNESSDRSNMKSILKYLETWRTQSKYEDISEWINTKRWLGCIDYECELCI